MSKFKVDQIVQFKPDYQGYFREFKDRDLTVMQVFSGDKHDQTIRVTLLEIEEMHLINTDHLIGVKNVTTN
jgi:hypothetical protein